MSSLLVILGNGPSLKGFDFKRLAQFDAIGMNVAYRYWYEIGWFPRCYICLNKVVGISHKDQIAKLRPATATAYVRTGSQSTGGYFVKGSRSRPA